MRSIMSDGAGKLLDELLAECVRQDASDLHLAPDLPPYLRVHGVLEPQASGPLSAGQIDSLAEELMRPFDRKPLDELGSLDGAVSAADGTRYRFNVFRRQG